jgi:hypothetical protein
MTQKTNALRAVCLALALTGSAGAQDKPQLAVIDLKAQAGVEQTKAQMLTDVLCTSIKNMDEYRVISREDINAMLMHVRDQQLLGCDDTRCMAQIGGALGVSRIVYGNIGMLGTEYLINLTILNIDSATVVNRISQPYAGSEAGLARQMDGCARLLFGKIASLAASEPQPFYRTPAVRYGLLGGGAVALGVAYLIYRQGDTIYQDQYRNATTKTAEVKYWEQVQQHDRNATVCIGVAAALLLTGGLTFAF